MQQYRFVIADCANLHKEVIEDKTDKEQYEILKLRKLTQDYYRGKGEGRPTKKDRRDMDEYVAGDADSKMVDEDWDLFFSDVDESTED